MRLLLILIAVVQLSGCAAFLETTAGTFVGSMGAEVAKEHLKKLKDSESVCWSCEDETPE